MSFSSCTNLNGLYRKIQSENLLGGLLDHRSPQAEDLRAVPQRNGDLNFSHFVLNVIFGFQSLAGPTCVGELWDNYLSHCPFLCTIRTMFNPLVLEASSARDPEFQYVHNFKFLFCIFSEILVYEHLEPILGNVDFILPRMCNRNSWYWNWIINLLIMTYNLRTSLLSCKICFLLARFMVEVMMIFQEWD